jgi:hypothetical protein
MFSEHDTDGTAFTGDARRLHCGEENALLLLVMAPIGKAFDEVGGHDENDWAEWLTGVQAPGSRFERGEHTFDDAMLIFEDFRSFHGIPPTSRKKEMPNGLELSGPAKSPSSEFAELAGSAPASG